MDKKRLKRTKNTAEEATPKKSTTNTSEVDQLDLCCSPDFPNSQECFSIGWDWSGQIKGTTKPTIRFVERPKKKKAFELLECHRPRRLVRKDDSESNDDTEILEELKALAAGFKRVSDPNSPVASPPSASQSRSTGVLLTPTALRNQPRKISPTRSVLLDKVESTKPTPSPTPTPTPSEKTKEALGADSGVDVELSKENFNDLLDESIGADLLAFTQDLELNYRRCESKTPNPKDGEAAGLCSSKKKSKLSLSMKKVCNVAQRSVCRRINNNVGENNPASTKSGVKDAEVDSSSEKAGNHGSRLEFDDFDEEALCSLGQIDEKVLKSKETPQTLLAPGNVGSAQQECTSDPNFDDDMVVSPEILDIIDSAEKKATQELLNNVPSLMEVIDIQHKRWLEREEKSLPQKASSSSSSKCTPEEIEKKRQEAKKRLQLKKKNH